MTREEEIIELTKRTCDAYRRQEPLERTCGGFAKCDCKCLQYNRCEAIYDSDWRKITHCKDCIHFRPYPKPVEDFDGRCWITGHEMDDDEYCSRGKKE